MAVFYGLFVGLFVYRGLTPKKVFAAFKFTAIVLGAVLFILGSTKAFGQLVTLYDVPQSTLALFAGLTGHPWLVLLLIGVFYIIVFFSGWVTFLPDLVYGKRAFQYRDRNRRHPAPRGLHGLLVGPTRRINGREEGCRKGRGAPRRSSGTSLWFRRGEASCSVSAAGMVDPPAGHDRRGDL